MQLPQTGGCQCGKIRYEITEEPQSVYTCHCLDCQRLTSSAFSLGIVVAEKGFRLTGIEPRGLQRTNSARGELVRLPLVRGSARCRANGCRSIIDGLGRIPGADVG